MVYRFITYNIRLSFLNSILDINVMYKYTIMFNQKDKQFIKFYCNSNKYWLIQFQTIVNITITIIYILIAVK